MAIDVVAIEDVRIQTVPALLVRVLPAVGAMAVTASQKRPWINPVTRARTLRLRKQRNHEIHLSDCFKIAT